MNILIIVKFYTEGIALHIAETLIAMGHAVRRFEPGFRSNRIGGGLDTGLIRCRGSFILPRTACRRCAPGGCGDSGKWLGPRDVVIVCHTIAGNEHSWRVAFYKNLSDYDVKLWGNPAPLWMAARQVVGMYQGRGVYNHDKVRAFRGAKIVVNNLHIGEIWGVNVRSFEAAGAGVF